MATGKSKTKIIRPKKARGKVGKKMTGAPLPSAQTSKRQARKIMRKVCSWFIRPEEIRKEVFALVRKGHSYAYAKQLTLVLSLSFKVSDHYEQLGAMNPALLKSQQDGSIEKGIWETINELSEAWKKLVEMK